VLVVVGPMQAPVPMTSSSVNDGVANVRQPSFNVVTEFTVSTGKKVNPREACMVD
jgi:hypothetical protein